MQREPTARVQPSSKLRTKVILTLRGDKTVKDSDRDIDEKFLVRILSCFWLALMLLFTIRSINETWLSRLVSVSRRVPEAFVGAALSWVMYLALKRLKTRKALPRLLVAAAMSMPFGIMFSILNAWLIYATTPHTGETCGGKSCQDVWFATSLAIEYSVNFSFVFLAWGAIAWGILASSEAISAERQAGVAKDQARLAQLRALHNQVNPHFLFNCLNSLGTLVDRGSSDTAREMITEMSSFLRYGLAVDPLTEVMIDDEVEMLRRYLEIERHRYAQRLKIAIRIDEDVRQALVLPLLMQPLVENAIKHGVASTSDTVEIRIIAERITDGRIRLAVDDDAPLARLASPQGSGVGLRNVRERLRARFDDQAVLTAGPCQGRGFRAEIMMPSVLR